MSRMSVTRENRLDRDVFKSSWNAYVFHEQEKLIFNLLYQIKSILSLFF